MAHLGLAQARKGTAKRPQKALKGACARKKGGVAAALLGRALKPAARKQAGKPPPESVRPAR